MKNESVTKSTLKNIFIPAIVLSIIAIILGETTIALGHDHRAAYGVAFTVGWGGAVLFWIGKCITTK